MAKKKPRKKPTFVDLASIDEDKRIAAIGEAVTTNRRTVAFVVDDDPGKADRYVTKLRERFPGIAVINRIVGPVPGTVSIFVAPPDEEKPV